MSFKAGMKMERGANRKWCGPTVLSPATESTVPMNTSGSRRSSWELNNFLSRYEALEFQSVSGNAPPVSRLTKAILAHLEASAPPSTRMWLSAWKGGRTGTSSPTGSLTVT
eukprot:10812600-Alexandrium_andersonii.AAC.1